MLYYAFEFLDEKADEHEAARSLLTRLARERLGGSYTVDKKNGVPYLVLEDGGCLYASVTHTDGLCAVAISDSCVGIDAERVRALERYREISKRLLREECLDGLDAFFIRWTRAEAEYKAYCSDKKVSEKKPLASYLADSALRGWEKTTKTEKLTDGEREFYLSVVSGV